MMFSQALARYHLVLTWYGFSSASMVNNRIMY